MGINYDSSLTINDYLGGLNYVASESNDLRYAMQENIKMGREVIDNLLRAKHHLVVTLEGGTLTGAAYTAGKELFVHVLIPLIERAETALEQVQTQLNRYHAAEVAMDEGDLYENQLLINIKLYREQQASVQQQMNEYMRLSAVHADDNMIERSNKYNDWAQEERYSLQRLEDKIREFETKLNKLYYFNDTINGMFSEPLAEFAQIMSIIAVLKLGEFRTSGHFSINVTNFEDAQKVARLRKYFTQITISTRFKDKFEEERAKADAEEVKRTNKALKREIKNQEKWLKENNQPDFLTGTYEAFGVGIKVHDDWKGIWSRAKTYNKDYADKEDYVAGHAMAYGVVGMYVGMGVGAVAGAIGGVFALPIIGGMIIGAISGFVLKEAYDHIPVFQEFVDGIGEVYSSSPARIIY